jgi:hypothetical protein
MNWETETKVNEWSGTTNVRHLAQVNTSDDKGRAYLEVHQVGDRYQWSVHIVVVNQPKLSRMVYGSFAVTPQALAVAKMTASRQALKTIREVEPLTLAA